jgi:iron complex outermembrane receptor protein
MSLRGFAAAVAAGAMIMISVSFADPAVSNSAADSGGLEPVVVTAQRKQESAQSIGIAISVLSGESLAAKSITYVNDLQNAVPSLQVEPAFGSGQPQFRIRGVGFIDYTSNNASPWASASTMSRSRCPFKRKDSCSTSTASKCSMDRKVRCTAATPRAARSTSSPTGRPPIRTQGFTSNTVRSTRSPAKDSSSGSIAEGLLGRLSVATEQGGGWQYNRLKPVTPWATRTRLPYAPAGMESGAGAEFSIRTPLGGG